MKLLISSSFLFFVVSSALAIRCNFIFSELNESSSSPFATKSNSNVHSRHRRGNNVIKGDEEFECESDTEAEGFIPLPVSIGNRQSFDRNAYEEDKNPCEESVRTYAPKELNTVYNQIKKLDQTTTIQEIEITKCLYPDSDCSNGQVVEEDRKNICDQKYTKITLRAIGEDGRSYYEKFYYPSACICQSFKKIT